MQTGTTLFQLRADRTALFDGSSTGIAIQRAVNVRPLPSGEGVALSGSVVEIARHATLDTLQAFTIEALINPTRIGPNRQNILEGQTPAVALFIDASGKLTSSMNIAGVWVSLDSGAVTVTPGRATRIRFVRDEAGNTELFIDNQVVARRTIAGTISPAGGGGLRVGASVDGTTHPFVGQISELSIRQGAVGADFLNARMQRAQTITQALAPVLKRVRVSLIPDESYARLQPIKDIMNAAGVQRISDLQTMRITTRTVMTRGKVLVAAKKLAKPPVKWGDIATQFRAATAAERKTMLAQLLTTQNSRTVLTSAATTAPSTGTITTSPVMTAAPVAPTSVVTAPVSPRIGVALPRAAALAGEPIADLIRVDRDVLRVDPQVITRIAERNPALWPAVTTPIVHTITPAVIPVDSAAIIAATLDLTDIQLVVEPNVKTLYIIAEQVICGNNASITWRRPGGVMPPRLDNPDLNGRSWSGVQTKPDSRDGLDGGPGGAGQPGLVGDPGVPAPALEMWVKNMTGMPNLDFNGEDAKKGGRGQSGGRGGNGADGALGKRIWAFGWHCTSDPGDGGDGGNGGPGGAGGRGGNGSNGGKISIGVLENTLESTVTNRAFRIKNQGGRAGRGGDGGPGGTGGAGGRSGVGETCRDAENGHPGAQGQPGAAGPDGFSGGIDALVEFFEFTEEAWDDLITRPWLNEVTPTHAFPGDQLTLRGSRLTSNDVVFLAGSPVPHTINPDESVSVTVPLTALGGELTIFVRRADGTESNRIAAYVKPQLEPLPPTLNPGQTITLKGRAFRPNASALINGSATPATVDNPTQLRFEMPGTGGSGSSGATVTVQVRNPDGLVSNTRTGQIPRILEVPFRYGQHNLSFANFTDGIPDWSTFEDTFGAAEVWHELLDPVFGHPVLTGAFYGFYNYFLKGKANGGLATGFCTSLSSLVAERFWEGRTDTPSVTKAAVHKMLTAIHGRLLSRESLIHFHDQGRQGVARVEQTYREIESTFLRGTDRNNAPMLFFIPSGAAWDAGYFDKLSDSHCILPWRFVYPVGRVPQLSPDGSTTLTDPDGVELFCWDCNKPESPNCRLRFRRVGSEIRYDYFADSSTAKFKSEDGVTLGMMRLADYRMADHDLPFSGPFGLTSFIIDFLLSPADLQVTDANGRRTGNFSGMLLSEIPNSRPCYLAPGCYMLPDSTALTRRIVGNATGTYAFHSIMPSGGSLALENVATAAGQVDVLAVSADANQVRFTPAAEKTFALTLGRTVGTEARALAIQGAGGGPAADVDVALSPDLSLVRVGNRGAARSITVRGFSVNRATNTPANRQFAAVNLPANHDLTIAVTNWTNLDASVEALPF
jgi:concanavalin A-like lectin/glucanase superfamily protein/IPT/TIG domain-containing protein